jgi:adenosylcobinamide-phosphate synthase
MSFLSLILALALEQWRPLVDRTRVFAPLKTYAQIVERQFNAGEHQHGILSWMLIMVPLVGLCWALYALCYLISPLLALIFNVVVLYVTIGFRQESHYFTDIHQALKAGELDKARGLLQAWQGHRADVLTPAEIARLTIEGALATSHRHVFGPIIWFIVLPGPVGAVLYRAAQFLYHRWSSRTPVGTAGGLYTPDTVMGDETDYLPTLAGNPSHAPSPDGKPGRFGEFARIAFEWIDAIPVRVTAATFAIVGDFEDAVWSWREQAHRWPDKLMGIVIAAGAGALGVRLGMPIVRAGLLEDRPELGVGDEADVAFLDMTVRLVWRALVLWLVLLAVVTFTAMITLIG